MESVKETTPKRVQKMLYSASKPPLRRKKYGLLGGDQMSLGKLPGKIGMIATNGLQTVEDGIVETGRSLKNPDRQWLQRVQIAAASAARMPALPGGVRVPVHP